MFLIDNFFNRISSDFRQRQLLPLKLLFFVHSSTMYVLYPYLTIHMRELGINVEETAIMSAVTPIVSIIMPPIAGLVADRIGNFKVILALFSGLGGAASLLLLLVPVGRITISYPPRTLLQVSTNASFINVELAEPYPCQFMDNVTIPRDIQIEACGLVCERPKKAFSPYARGPQTPAEEEAAILRARSYTVSPPGGATYSYTLTARDLPLYKENKGKDDDIRNSRLLQNPGHYPTSVRKLKDDKFFFPTSGLYHLSCKEDGEGSLSCKIIQSPRGPGGLVKPSTYKLRAAFNKDFNGIILNKMMYNNSRTLFNVTGSPSIEGVIKVDVPLPNIENSLEVDAVLTLGPCYSQCLATMPRKELCTTLSAVTEFDISLTFWLYLSIRVFISMISGTAFAMFEGAVIAILREHKADYGLQRIYATIGGMMSSPLSGWLIDYASQNKQYTDFRPAFYLYAGLKILSAMLMLTINLEFKAPATNVFADVLTVLRKIEIIALFITCFILGTAWGYIESFLFWLLQDLGASRSLMGITITVGGIAGLPLLVMSGPIIARIGHANVLFIGFVFYAIRLLGYSLIYNPWMCLIFEAMESVTSSLSFTAAVTYAAKLSTMTTDSSVQGLLGGIYFGVGKGAGSLIGGYLMEAVGTRPTYQIFSAVTLLTGCLYFLFNRFYIVHHAESSMDEKDDKGKEIEKHSDPKTDGKEPNKKASKKEILSNDSNKEKMPMTTAISITNNYQGANGGAYTNKAFNKEEGR
ncbi:uncharacterized protein [Halyomorpha halys]|uniref:uncharacterized protein n=1 Tax=Halyomorpha halys TaxID=286706 RepID=UPI0006D51EDE|nr:uncharacterized protein LOC106680975 [Halyomorpha halys]XP_014276524.1 uncharacterized protein LOC106680975 [Halyomorpha halys]